MRRKPHHKGEFYSSLELGFKGNLHVKLCTKMALVTRIVCGPLAAIFLLPTNHALFYVMSLCGGEHLGRGKTLLSHVRAALLMNYNLMTCVVKIWRLQKRLRKHRTNEESPGRS